MDLGKIKRDVLLEIERDRKFAQADLERVVADNTIAYEAKINQLKEIIQRLVSVDTLANATNNIFIPDESTKQQEPKPQQKPQPQSENVVEALNQSHSE